MLTDTSKNPDPMQNKPFNFLLASVAVMSIAQRSMASEPSLPMQSQASSNITIAQRALPTITNNVSQPAHYQHVYIDANGKNSGSIQTITLADAVASGVLASSDLQAKPLDKIDSAKLNWVILDKGFSRPSELEGVGGADVSAKNFSEVNFALNESEILEKTKLDALLKVASRVNGMFYVVGYADETGVEAKNLTLSQDRAKAVADALVAGGVNVSRVKFFGAGVSHTYTDLAANRRASIALLIQE